MKHKEMSTVQMICWIVVYRLVCISHCDVYNACYQWAQKGWLLIVLILVILELLLSTKHAVFVCLLMCVAMRLPVLLLYSSPTDLPVSEVLATEWLFCTDCCLAHGMLCLNSADLHCREKLLTRTTVYFSLWDHRMWHNYHNPSENMSSHLCVCMYTYVYIYIYTVFYHCICQLLLQYSINLSTWALLPYLLREKACSTWYI